MSLIAKRLTSTASTAVRRIALTAVVRILRYYTVTLLSIFLIVSSVLSAEEALTNEKVAHLVKAKVSDELIVSLIQSSVCDFKIDADSIIALKGRGVSETVIKAMIEKASGKIGRHSAESPGNTKTDSSGKQWADVTTGVYYFSTVENNYIPLTSRTLEEKSGEGAGGKFLSGLTFGKKKFRYSGTLSGANSESVIASGDFLSFFIVVSANQSIDDYVLVRMNTEGDHRIAELARGGVLRGGEGQFKKYNEIVGPGSEIPYVETASYQIAPGVFKVTPKRPLLPGEYVFYIRGTHEVSVKIIGKGFDFSVQSN